MEESIKVIMSLWLVGMVVSLCVLVGMYWKWCGARKARKARKETRP